MESSQGELSWHWDREPGMLRQGQGKFSVGEKGDEYD